MMDAGPRPLHYIKILFDRDLDGCGEWIADIFRGEQAAIRNDLAKLTAQGKLDDDPSVEEAKRELVWSIDLLHDIDEALVVPYMGKRTMRLFRGGQAQWAQDILRDEQTSLYADLADLRAQGKNEADPLIQKVRQRIIWTVNVLRDIDVGRIHLEGPDEDPRK